MSTPTCSGACAAVGNFGIVVEFEFRLHPVGTRTLVAELTFPLHRAVAALRGWRDLAEEAARPATLTAEVCGGTVTLGYVWAGDPEAGRAMLPALRSIGVPDGEVVREVPYLELQARDDSIEGHAYRRYWKGHYLPGLPDGAIGALADRDPADATLPGVSLQAYGGAIADVDDDATAFSHRRTRFEYVAAVKWSDPGQDSLRMAAARREAAKLDPFAAGAYVNALSDEGASGVRRAYPDAKRARLTAVKDAYDPDNVFHLNHNIAPPDTEPVAPDHAVSGPIVRRPGPGLTSMETKNLDIYGSAPIPWTRARDALAGSHGPISRSSSAPWARTRRLTPPG